LSEISFGCIWQETVGTDDEDLEVEARWQGTCSLNDS